MFVLFAITNQLKGLGLNERQVKAIFFFKENLTNSGTINAYESNGTAYNENVEFSELETSNLKNAIYEHILLLEFLNTTKIKKNWVEKGNGLIRFEHDGNAYIRN